MTGSGNETSGTSGAGHASGGRGAEPADERTADRLTAVVVPLNFSGRELDSTATRRTELRAGVGRLAPLSSRLFFKGHSREAGGLAPSRNRVRAQAVTRSTTHTADLAGIPVQSRLVEGVETDAPGCRTQTGHARSSSVGIVIGRGFDSPRVHHLHNAALNRGAASPPSSSTAPLGDARSSE